MKHILLVLLAASLLNAACSSKAPTSILIENARIVDGSGAPAFTGAVRIDGDRIIAIGELRPLAGEQTVAANGLVLAPGFIDTHSHHDGDLQDYRDMVAAVSQGITTIVRGADGFNSGTDDGGYLSVATFNEQFAETPAALNIASFAAHGSIRGAVMGDDFRRPATADEIEQMGLLVANDMASGALGLATGLEYMPGIYATTDEVVQLARVAAADGGHYMSHIRDEDDKFLDAIDELLQIGREASIPVHISHIKLADSARWGTTGPLLETLDAARAAGIDVTADIYSYLYWQSVLTVLFPDKDYTDRDVATFTFAHTTQPETLILTEFAPDPSYEGLSVAEIAGLREQDVETTLLQLTQESVAYTAETGKSGDSILAKGMSDSDVLQFMGWPYANICTDGSHTGGHPRGWGSFPRFFSRYAPRIGLSVEEAIRKMTSLGADNVGIGKRGRLETGYFADLVLLDPELFTDNATFEQSDLPASGVISVWVNGEVVFENGQTTGRFPGRAVPRAGFAN